MKPTMCIHGFSGSRRSFDTLFGSQDPSNARNDPLGSCVHRFELHGHGKQPDLSSATFLEETQRLKRAIEDSCSEPPVLLGYSMGARLALSLLVHAPSAVDSAVLIGVNPGLRTPRQRRERKAWESEWIDLLCQSSLEEFDARWSNQPLFASQRALPFDVREAMRQQRLGHENPGLISALEVLGLAAMPCFWGQLGDIPKPVILACGAQDEKFVGLARQIREEASHWKLTIIPDAGHNLLLEAPDQVRDLVARCASGTAFDSKEEPS